MAKRIAASQLTDRNWDEEDEKEEAGEFKTADSVAMGARKLITAKRRIPEKSDTEASGGGAFKGFGGFGSGGAGGGFGSGSAGGFNFGSLTAKSTATSSFSASSAPQFSFGNASKVAAMDNGNGEKKSNEVKPLFSFGGGAKAADVEPPAFKFGGSVTASPSASATLLGSVNSTMASASPSTTSVSSSELLKSYSPQGLSQLKALNESVTKWIREHVDANPYCILLPIFSDYERHLTSIDKRLVEGGRKAPSATAASPSSSGVSTVGFGSASSAGLNSILNKPASASNSSITIDSGSNTTLPKIGSGFGSSNAEFSASASIFAASVKASTAAPASSSTTLSSSSATGGVSSIPAFQFSASPSSIATSLAAGSGTTGASAGGFNFSFKSTTTTAASTASTTATTSTAPPAAATTASSFSLATTAAATTSSAAPTFSFSAGTGSTASTPFSFGAGIGGAGLAKPLGVFGASPASSSAPSSIPPFTFGMPASSQPTVSLFGSAPPSGGFFSKAVAAAATGKSDDQDNEGGGDDGKEEEYVPPVVESTQVKEENALHTVKCKLFAMKPDGWKERGVGYLHLKPCGEKTQLLIRADNTLGTLLLNINLTSALPVKKVDKGNGVILTCVPNPPIDKDSADKPANLLIRVKTSDESEALFAKIVELKR